MNRSRNRYNGQGALDNSVQVKGASPRRIGVASGEYAVLDRTRALPGDVEVYHGHVRKWDDLHPDMQKALREDGITDRKGEILKGGCNG